METLQHRVDQGILAQLEERWRLGLLKLVYRITSWVTGYGIKVEIEGE